MKHLLALAIVLSFAMPSAGQKLLVSIDSAPNQMELSRDGRYFAVVANTSRPSREDVLKIWDTSTGREIRLDEKVRESRTVFFAFSPGENLAVVCYSPKVFKGVIDVASLPEWKKIRSQKVEELKGRLNAITFGPKGKWFARLMSHRKIALVETATGKTIRAGELEIDKRFGFGTKHLYVSPDGKYLATYTYNNGTEVWDATTLKRVVQFPALLNRNSDGTIKSNGQGFSDMAFVPGKPMVLIRDHRGLQLCNFDSKEPVKVFKVSAQRIGGFLENGRVCVIGDAFIDLKTHKKTTILPRIPGKNGSKHKAQRTCVSTDGSTLAALYDWNHFYIFDAKKLLSKWREKQKAKPKKPVAKSGSKKAKQKSKAKSAKFAKSGSNKVDGKTMAQWFLQLQSGESKKRREAAEALAKFGKRPVPRLIKLLGHEDVARRRRAAQALGVIGPPASDAIHSLMKALGDADDRVKKYAQQALLKIKKSK